MTFDQLDIGDGIMLTRVQEGDAEEIFALVDSCRDYLREWFAWIDRNKTVEGVLDFVERAEKQYTADNGFQCCIRWDGNIVGTIGYVYVNWVDKRTELGYWVGEAYQGKGIATKATRASRRGIA